MASLSNTSRSYLTMYLKALLAAKLPQLCHTLRQDCKIDSLSQDSRQLKPGALFLAYPGYHDDGRRYIKEAIKRGAVAVIAEQENLEQKLLKKCPVPIIPIKHLKSYVGSLAAHFYEYPSQKMIVIGITGTNGKTSCSHFIAACMSKLHQTCGVIGGINHGFYGKEGYRVLSTPTKHLTTPDVVELHRLLADFIQRGIFHVAVEVSSHGIDQGRIDGIEFTIAAFTNLSHDHLDYHKTLQHYATTKKKLFTEQPKLKYAILNQDDRHGLIWSQELRERLPVYTYSVNSKDSKKNCVYASDVQVFSLGFQATVHTPWGTDRLRNTVLMGCFNLSNLLLVLTVLGVLNIPLSKILPVLGELLPVTGRMEPLAIQAKKPLIVIDYAHTPDGLKKALCALRKPFGKLWCIFGCGGNRDVKKRPLMGAIAEAYADVIMITQDNPRYENPQRIVEDIIKGLKAPEKAMVELDRKKAITNVIAKAKSEDTVLIAGKGHEDYQIIGNTDQVFSDRNVAENALLKSMHI